MSQLTLVTLPRVMRQPVRAFWSTDQKFSEFQALTQTSYEQLVRENIPEVRTMIAAYLAEHTAPLEPLYKKLKAAYDLRQANLTGTSSQKRQQTGHVITLASKLQRRLASDFRYPSVIAGRMDLPALTIIRNNGVTHYFELLCGDTLDTILYCYISLKTAPVLLAQVDKLLHYQNQTEVNRAFDQLLGTAQKHPDASIASGVVFSRHATLMLKHPDETSYSDDLRRGGWQTAETVNNVTPHRL